MSKVKQTRQFFDQELADLAQKRTIRREYIVSDGVLVYVSREVIVPAEQYTEDRTPWWKKAKKKTRRK